MKLILLVLFLASIGAGIYRFSPYYPVDTTVIAEIPADPKAPPLPESNPPLVEALQASIGDKESQAKIASLLAGGASPNSVDKGGRPIISLAVRNNDLAALEALLKAGADPNIRDRELGWTPLMYAAYQAGRDQKFLRTAELLLEKGADVHATKEGVSALHVAINNLDPNSKTAGIVEVLLKAGANPNGEPVSSPNTYSLSPILTAAIGGKTAAALALAKGGAKLTAEPGGKTPAQTARDNKHPELALALEKLEKGGEPEKIKSAPPAVKAKKRK